ncbi:DUF3108 domain-containing protein [Glaciecola sp. 1036]|uniref:DUF3108 domain-containing protein n=1 Tax=Alteromonadaceae TaxID=72275 RepID=UPI003CFC2290
MKISIILSLVLSFLIVAVQANADENRELKTFSAKYTAYHDEDDVGQASLNLFKIAEDTYKVVYDSKVSKFFLSDKRHEESVFQVEGDKLIPQTYEYLRTGTGRNKSLSVSFDAERQKIFIDDKETYDWQGELDNQLFRIDLSTQLANKVTDLRYDFINYRGEKRFYDLQVLDTETLQLPYGQIEATKVRINRETNKRLTYAWFAPSLGYTLVRLQQFKEGKEQGDIQLSEFYTN